MKKFILTSAFLVVATTTVLAQKSNPLEIKYPAKSIESNENNQFKFVSHEELEVYLKFNLKKSSSYNVLILNDRNQIVYSKKINKEGLNKVSFTTEQDEVYTVKLISDTNANLLAFHDKK